MLMMMMRMMMMVVVVVDVRMVVVVVGMRVGVGVYHTQYVSEVVHVSTRTCRNRYCVLYWLRLENLAGGLPGPDCTASNRCNSMHSLHILSVA